MSELRPICKITNEEGSCKGCINQDQFCKAAKEVSDKLALIHIDLSFNNTVQIISEDGFRSDPKVNMDEDMIRVKLDMPKWKWRRIKKLLTEEGTKDA